MCRTHEDVLSAPQEAAAGWVVRSAKTYQLHYAAGPHFVIITRFVNGIN